MTTNTRSTFRRALLFPALTIGLPWFATACAESTGALGAQRAVEEFVLAYNDHRIENTLRAVGSDASVSFDG